LDLIHVANVSFAAFLNAASTSSNVVCFLTSTVKSTTEPVMVGTRSAVPSNLPFNCGNTKPIAFAAPVELGMILLLQHVLFLIKYLFYVVDPLMIDQLCMHELLS
jgi:hypothetical protein